VKAEPRKEQPADKGKSKGKPAPPKPKAGKMS
jgi:hypothetical protein